MEKRFDFFTIFGLFLSRKSSNVQNAIHAENSDKKYQFPPNFHMAICRQKHPSVHIMLYTT